MSLQYDVIEVLENMIPDFSLTFKTVFISNLNCVMRSYINEFFFLLCKIRKEIRCNRHPVLHLFIEKPFCFIKGVNKRN